MNSKMFYHSPREWVTTVKDHLESKMNINIGSIYKRKAIEISEVTFSYQVGESDPYNSLSNEERSQHNIELRFMIEVPTSINEFDLEALDASCRLEREICNQFFGDAFNQEEAELVSNLPSKFDPENGIFARVVTMRQQIYVGPLDQEFYELTHCTGDNNEYHQSGIEP
ncbi:putative uncharacterized phage protein [Aliivibrio wodanis]|uniref:Uncharacterized phage protein n=1 Tax=Aliivibrio wodanis TaxID=80852 RepID=A0A090KJ28_9GAMM|nr:putative uncharacterized phage protein [Aliivibrio wodanis]